MEVLCLELREKELLGALVQAEIGDLINGRIERIILQENAPHKVMSAFHELVRRFEWKGPIGFVLPCPVLDGIVLDQSVFMDPAWEDTNVGELFGELTDQKVVVVNKADAAISAEMEFGVGQHRKGVIIYLEFGDYIFSSIVVNGQVVPNVELGRIEIKGITAEERASARAREEEGIKKKAWAKRIQLVLSSYERIFHPDAFILSGDVSEKSHKIFPFIEVESNLIEAELGEKAALLGAALAVKMQA